MVLSRKLFVLSILCGCLFWSCSSTSGEKKSTSTTKTEISAKAEVTPAPPVPSTPAEQSPTTKTVPSEPWKEFTAKIPQSSLVDRFLEASRLLLGVPYVNGPLGEGDAGGPDPEPRFDLTRADCVTYLEESLALALTVPRSDRSYVSILDAIRYQDGRVSFASRNHYMVLDWIPSNSWLLEDVTEDIVPDGHTRKITREIDRATFLRDHGAEPRPGKDKLEKIEIELIPMAEIPSATSKLRSGDLVFWVAKKEGIDIAHTGMVVRNAKDGSVVHRHGSSKAGATLDEPLLEYAERTSSVFDGIVVLRLKPEAKPPGLNE